MVYYRRRRKGDYMEQLDLIAQRIYPKYPRPAKFSDPGGDFSDDELKELIRKQDCELTEADLICIFQGALPAGVYHEVMYFLPIALQHIVKNQENDTLDHLLRWISYNQNALQADNCYDDLLNFFELLFVQWTSFFDLNDDYPKNCAVVSTLIEELNVPAFNLYGDILLQKHLGNAATYETAAWLIYLLENHLWGFAKRSQYLSLVAVDKILIKKAYDLLVSEVMEDEKLLLFWDRIFTRVGIC